MKRRAGFSLVEVMTVLTIVCILAALTFPSLHQYVIRSKRTQAQGALQQLMQQQERYYSHNNTYLEFSARSTAEAEKAFKWWSGDTAAASAYELRAVACSGQALAECVQLNAIPGTANVDSHFEDAACGTLTLGSDGERGATGVAADCWP